MKMPFSSRMWSSVQGYVYGKKHEVNEYFMWKKFNDTQKVNNGDGGGVVFFMLSENR